MGRWIVLLSLLGACGGAAAGVVGAVGDDHRTACSSINYHQDHFGHLFDVHTADGNTAHSSCIGFGVERAGVAMFNEHGTDVAAWPAPVRTLLAL